MYIRYNLPMQPAIFLDRDGVIVHNNPAYIRTLEDVIFYPQALEALALLKQTPYKLIIITNQSAISRGLLNIDSAHRINNEVILQIEKSGGRVDDVFMCPHSPEDHCLCRKPKPGLILQAASKHEIDLVRSIMIGDALTDIIAGQAAGIKTNILVLTGRGKDQISNWDHQNPNMFEIYTDLLIASKTLIHKYDN